MFYLNTNFVKSIFIFLVRNCNIEKSEVSHFEKFVNFSQPDKL